MRTILKMLGAPLAVLAVAACSSAGGSSARGPRRVRVVAAESFWASIAGQLGGADADVTSIISRPATDPHDYEPTAGDARALAGARLVIENGIGYDPWAQQLLDVGGEPGRTVLDAGRLLHLAAGANPHQWYSRRSVLRVVDAVTADLETIDPAHRVAYARRRREFESTALAPYDALVTRIRSQFAGTPIGASESVVGPLAETLGLRIITPEGFLTAVAEGSEPSASDKATVDAQIRERRIKVFVFNRQNSTPDVQRLVDEAGRAGVPVVTITETLSPANATFQDWQARELRALLAALRGAGR